MTNNVKISVIIPVYKVEQYLSECLDSVINQTYKNLEIICVDDGSPDNSGKILDEYASKDNRIKVIHKENGGVSSARNAGLDTATGEWISFVDADDYLDTNFYASVMGKDYSNTDVIQFGYQTVESRKNKIKEFENNELVGFDDIISSIDKCYLWNKLWKNELLNKNNIRFVKGIAFCEDVLFTAYAAICSKVWANNKTVGYFYRFRDTSISNDKSKEEKRKFDKYTVAKKIMELTTSQLFDNKQLSAVKDFAIKQLVSVEDLSNKKIYQQYLSLFGRDKKLLKKRKKAIKKWLFSFSISKQKLVILGKNFWPIAGGKDAA